MDYKEKYEQALAKAKELSIDGYLDAVAVDDIFPELKENEDEKIRKDICTLVTGWRNRVNIKGFASMEDMLAWLKKQDKQKPIWSEEDEKILNLIIARLHSHPNIDLEEYSKEYDWLNYRLKSLKPQSQWKPSDEQMEAIKWAVRIMNESGCYHSPLVSLYKDLEQLKAL